MHHVDANKMYGEKTWRQLRKNAASNIEQVLETAPHKTETVRPPTMKTSLSTVVHAFASIVVIGVLTVCVLLHSMCYLKAAQINVQHSLIWEFMLSKFEYRSNQKHLLYERWRYNWSLYSNQMVQEILPLEWQELQWPGKIRKTNNCGYQGHVPSHRSKFSVK